MFIAVEYLFIAVEYLFGKEYRRVIINSWKLRRQKSVICSSQGIVINLVPQ